MAKKIFLRDENNNKVLPITRGELVLDSSGNPAFHSNEFLATDSQPGLMSPVDKQKLETIAGNTIDAELSNTSTNPVQNKVLTQIINSIREKYLKSAIISGNKITITDQSNNTVEFAAASALSNYVTLNTALTITGEKTIFVNNTDVWSLGGKPYTYTVTRNGGWVGPLINVVHNYNNATQKACLGAYGGEDAIDYFYFDIDSTKSFKIRKESVEATKFIKSGGTSSQFLKADGSVDSTTYATSASLGNYLPLSGGTITSSGNVPLKIQTSNTYSAIRFLSKDHYRTFGVNENGHLFVTDDNAWNNEYAIYHSGNLTKVSLLSNDKGYLTSRGYIGTTAVLANSATLSLTGIVNITATGNYATTASDESSRAVTVENINGKIGLYASTNRGLYDYSKDKWVIATNGSNTFLLLGKVGIGTLNPVANLDVVGTGRFTQNLTLSGTTSADAALRFSRTESYNYIIFPGNVNTSTLAFGYDQSHAGTYYVMNSIALYPAVDNKFNLGVYGTARWKNVYAVTFTGDLTGNASSASNLKNNSSGAVDSISFYRAFSVSETLASSPSYCKPANVDSDGNTMILRMRWSSGAFGHDIYAGPNESELWHRNTKNSTEVWRKFIDSGNIGSQSVSYATSSGNADTVDNKHASDFKYVNVNNYSYTPNLAFYDGSSASTNYYKLSITNVNNVWTMLYVEMSIKENYSYANYGKIILHINKSASNTIDNFTIHTLGQLSSSIKAYASNNSSSFDIYIAGNWSWPTLNVDRITFGDSAAYATGKNITLTKVTALPSSYSTASIITGIHSNNYTSYTVKKDGTGATGTWGINISGTASKATNDVDGNAFKTIYLRKVTVARNTENDFNTFENMTLTGRGDPLTGASLKNAPWTGSGPAGGYGVLTYLWSNYGTQIAWGYNSNRIYIRPKYHSSTYGSSVWRTEWDSLALTSDLKNPADYYWANIKVSSSSNAATSPTFANASITGDVAAGRVIIYDGTNSLLLLKTASAGANAYLAGYTTGGAYGADVVLNSGSALVLGAGESATDMYSNNVDSLQGSKNLYLTADGAVKVFTNCDTIANRKHVATFETSGYAYFNSYINIGGHEKNASSPTYVWGSNDTDSFLRSYKTSSLSVGYANSAGYTTRLYANSTGDLLTYPGDYSLSYSRFQSNASNIFPVSDNANGCITAHLHSGNYFAQIGLSSNGRMYYRTLMSQTLDSGVAWKEVAWTSDIPTSLPANGGNSSTVGGYSASNLVKFYLSPMTSDAPADSAKSWFINTMPSASGAIVYNVPGSEKTIIVGKSTGLYGHMLLLNYADNYLRILRYLAGAWKTTDWEKISAGYADSAERANYLSGHSLSPDNSHPRHGARIFYSWNTGQVGNATEGYSTGITIGSNPNDTNYGFQIVQNLWDDRTYTRRYNNGWQNWKTLAWTSDIPTKISQLINDSGFVTRNISTNTNTNPFIVSRDGGTVEALKIGVDDNTVHFVHEQDETVSDFLFKGKWNDTETGGGKTAGEKFIKFGLSNSDHNIYVGSSKVLHSGNYSSYALPLSGGEVKGTYPYQQCVLTLDTDNAYYTILRFKSKGINKGRLQWADDTTHFCGFGLTNDTTGDRLGLSDSGAPFYNGNTLIHSGNYNSYSPTLTGSGANGTWNINISGNASSADIWDGKHFVKSYNEASDIDWSSLMWSANAACTDIASMSYAALMNVGTDLYRGWQIWNNRNDHRLYWRPAKQDASGWAEVRVLLDNYNYTSYLGYIGTTAVQSSSAVQALTGISRINNSTSANLYLGNSGNQGWVMTLDICSHSGSSYWVISAAGNAWFKKVNIGYAYGTNGSNLLNITGGLIDITNNGNTLSIGSRNATWCHFENSANIAFYFNNTIHSTGGFTVYSTSYGINSSGVGTFSNVQPVSNNTYTLGTSSLKWKNVYATTFNGDLSGNASSATNADTVDKFHISVDYSAGTDDHTIYFVI